MIYSYEKGEEQREKVETDLNSKPHLTRRLDGDIHTLW
jgi:hypothetical protein